MPWPLLLSLAVALSPPLQAFAGFSGDGRLFAYGGFSPGAGVPTLTVLRCADGKVERVFAATSAAAEAEARAFLRRHRFDAHPAPSKLPRGAALAVRSEHGRAEVLLRRAKDGPEESLYRTPPTDNVRALHLWGFSKDGRCVAFREELASGTEFGPAAVFLVVEIAPTLRRLEPPKTSPALAQ